MENEKPVNENEAPEGSTLLAYIKGYATAWQQKAVEEWIEADAAHETELLQIARLYHAQRTAKRIASRDSLRAFAKVEQKIAGKQRRIWLRRVATAAACIAGVILLSAIFSQRSVVQPLPPQVITIQSNPGMRTHFNLPDHSTVYLNAGSTISYTIPFEGDKRSVSLIGEAYFKVTPDSERPFIISTFNDRLEVKVLGTEFNIEAYPGDGTAYTTLVEGSVSILLKNANGLITEHQLSPSQKATYSIKNDSFGIKAVNTVLETGWMSGKVIFKDTPLPEVLRKLSHFYDVDFRVMDKVMETYLFTGTFNNRQLEHVLEYLKISSGIENSFTRIEKDGSETINRQTIILRKKK